jgi:hypothetical protein
MTDPNKTTGEKLDAVAERVGDAVAEAIADAEERGRNAATPTPATGISSSDMEAAILKRCDSCQRPGGAIYELAHQVGKLADEVRGAFKILDGREGEKRAWAVLRIAMVPVSCVVLGFVLNHLSAKRSDDMLKRQTDIAAEVAKQLKQVQDAATTGHTMLAPESDHFAQNTSPPTPPVSFGLDHQREKSPEK